MYVNVSSLVLIIQEKYSCVLLSSSDHMDLKKSDQSGEKIREHDQEIKERGRKP